MEKAALGSRTPGQGVSTLGADSQNRVALLFLPERDENLKFDAPRYLQDIVGLID
jgi:hypothetical protein